MSASKDPSERDDSAGASRPSFIKRFFDNYSKEPEEKPPLIPGPWRIPFFTALALISLAAVILLIEFVVIPGIHAQQSATPTLPPAASSNK